MPIWCLPGLRFRRFLLAALAASLAIASQPTQAAPEKPHLPVARGLPVQTPCHTDDLQGFKEALLRHDLARQAFRTKFRTGFYARPGALNADLVKQEPQALIERTAKAIATIADDRTPLLLYDIGTEPDEPKTLCIWLIGREGLIASATTRLPKQPLALLARNTLNVTAMAATRAPVPRRAASASTPVDPAAPPETEAMPMDEMSALLLPLPVAVKLANMGAERILILPVADLGTVPWPALPFDGAMLIDRMAPVMLADIDWILQEPAPFTPQHGGVVIGDPDLSGDKRYSFTPLPSAREEADAVSMRWSARRFVGAEASRKPVLDALPRAGGLIYFATHGIADPVNPMDGSFLALKDDYLYARDIKKLELLDRPLIVMSACQTGLGKVFNAGVFGLARAWWQAGASQIVTSLWNVDDDATRDLMIDFIGQLSSGDGKVSREQALRKAMLNTRQIYRDPAYWAGFSLFGLPTPQQR